MSWTCHARGGNDDASAAAQWPLPTATGTGRFGRDPNQPHDQSHQYYVLKYDPKTNLKFSRSLVCRNLPRCFQKFVQGNSQFRSSSVVSTFSRAVDGCLASAPPPWCSHRWLFPRAVVVVYVIAASQGVACVCRGPRRALHSCKLSLRHCYCARSIPAKASNADHPSQKAQPRYSRKSPVQLPGHVPRPSSTNPLTNRVR